MKIWQIVIKEIYRRKLNFGLGLVSVILAVTALVGALTMLKAHDLRTHQIIARKQAETEARMAALEDDYRKIMKIMGFNVLILPEDQNLGDLYSDDFASKYMPEEYVDRLSRSPIVSIQHLLPSLQQKIVWPEKQRAIILIGTRGEVPFLHRDSKEPILVPVAAGTMVLGYELHRSLGLISGGKAKLLGREFTIAQCNEERGTKDDITIWIDLKEAQELLNKPGMINAILALKCHCAGNAISMVRSDIAKILPGTRVIEQTTKVLTRAEARDRAAKEAREALEAEKQNRAKIRAEQEKFAAILVPLIIVASAVWIGLLFITNVRDRRSEIGILRAIGAQAKTILHLFLLKALFMGVCGALVGFFLGIFLGAAWQKTDWSGSLVNPGLFVLVLLLAPALAIIAGWIPALLASQQDPATVLREE